MALSHHSHRPTAWTFAAAVALVSVVLAACGSSKSSTTNTTAAPTTIAPGSPARSPVVSSAGVAGVGTVLVNDAGHTLYVLTSEKGGKVTCTASNGCSSIWPPILLTGGATSATAAGAAQQSKLGTARSPVGATYVTYAGYPLYAYRGDATAGSANGKGISSFGGTWWPISPAGALVTSGSSTPATSY